MNSKEPPPLTQPPKLAPATKAKTNKAAAASFLLAILPFVGRFLRALAEMPVDGVTSAAVWIAISTMIAFSAIIVGMTALFQISKDQSVGRGWAIAGICIGAFQLLVYLVAFLAAAIGR